MLKDLIENSEAIVIGAGAGLSLAAGHEYAGKRFRENFSDFEKAFGFHDMYTGGFYPFPNQETFWAYWSRMIWINRYNCPAGETYDKLLKIVKDKNYFVITTNVDHCFQKSGFDKKRLYYTQGDYGLFQCSVPCKQQTYDNYETVKAMYEQQNAMMIPSSLLPKCPNCGRAMTTNLRCDNRFVEDAGWHEAQVRYKKFLKDNENNKVLFLEIGVGYNTPGIIKIPFQIMTFKNKNAHYCVINPEKTRLMAEIEDRTTMIY